MPDNDTVSKLLRLKRYEQPPPEYFENFLREFHHRQRAELLRRPAWRMALDRAQAVVEGWFANFTPAQLSYAGASFAVLAVAGFMTVSLLEHPGTTVRTLALGPKLNSIIVPTRTEAVASVPPAGQSPVAAPRETAMLQLVNARGDSGDFTLDPQIRFPAPVQPQVVQSTVANRHPRYVLDARPVSYEPPFSF